MTETQTPCTEAACDTVLNRDGLCEDHHREAKAKTETMTPEDLDFAANASYWAGAAAAARQQQEAAKRLYALKGQTVTVVKGRKVPLGTTGVCFYSGEGQWGWRVGFKTEDGETVWTAVTNVEAVDA